MSLPNAGSAIYAKLSGAGAVSTLVSSRVWDTLAPQGQAMPYIVYYLASGLIPNATPHDAINWVYRVDCVGATRASANAVADAVYDTLHESSVTLTGWSNFWLACENVTTMPERATTTEEGDQRWHYIVDVRLRASKD